MWSNGQKCRVLVLPWSRDHGILWIIGYEIRWYECSHSESLTLFRMDIFRATHGWRGHTNILKWWNLAQLYLTRRRSNTQNYVNRVTYSWFLLTLSFFHWKSANFAISRNTDIDWISVHNLWFFWLLLSL